MLREFTKLNSSPLGMERVSPFRGGRGSGVRIDFSYFCALNLANRPSAPHLASALLGAVVAFVETYLLPHLPDEVADDCSDDCSHKRSDQ